MQGRAVHVPRIRDVVVGAAVAAILVTVAPDDGGVQSESPEARQLALPSPRLPSRSKQRCHKDRPERCKFLNFRPPRPRHAALSINAALAGYAASERRLRAFLTAHALDLRV